MPEQGTGISLTQFLAMWINFNLAKHIGETRKETPKEAGGPEERR